MTADMSGRRCLLRGARGASSRSARRLRCGVPIVQVAAGEMLAVMGPSGSGKSTLLHCLAGIFVPDQGEIVFDGQRLDQMDETRRTELRRTAFGFVFQFGQLVPELTAADNIALPLLLGRVRRKAAYQTAAQWLSRLGLADKERPAHRGAVRRRGAAGRDRPGRWSIGPQVLFADEPTGSLDSLTGEKVMDLLTGLARSRAPPWSWSPTTRGSPPTPTAR